MIPNSSRRKLMFVFCLSSPPSVINTRTHPPLSMYSRKTWNWKKIHEGEFSFYILVLTSPAVNLSLGPPNTMSLAPLSLSGVMSSLCTPIVQWCLRRDCKVLKPELGRNSSFFEALKKTVFLEEESLSPLSCGKFMSQSKGNQHRHDTHAAEKNVQKGKGYTVYGLPLPWDTGFLLAFLPFPFTSQSVSPWARVQCRLTH